MKTKDWLQAAEQQLNHIATARLDALVLLEDAAKKDRAWLLAHPEFELSAELVRTLKKQLKQRAEHVPLAYIRGKSEFYGREFLVTPDTLEPRPESETMIELLLKYKPLIIGDIGTGSGCLAITAKLELPKAQVYATEINQAALDVAKRNATALNADITFFEGNLLEPLQDTSIDTLLCNLPYVPDSYTINEAAMQEPKVAIFGGKDGLDLYREMFKQIEIATEKPTFIFTESLPFQHDTLEKIAKDSGYKQVAKEDFIQVFQS